MRSNQGGRGRVNHIYNTEVLDSPNLRTLFRSLADYGRTVGR